MLSTISLKKQIPSSLFILPAFGATAPLPDSLKLTVTLDGVQKTLHLHRRSIRGANFAVRVWSQSNGYTVLGSTPEVRTFRGTPPPYLFEGPVGAHSLEDALAHYTNHYAQCDQLQQESLLSKAQEKEEFTDPFSLNMWRNISSDFLQHEGFADYLQTALAFDAVCKDRPTGKDNENAYYNELIANGFFTEPREIRNLSKFRLAKRLWDSAWNRMSQTTKNQPVMIEAQRAMSIKNQADYLDCDIIHASILGHEDPEGLINRVTSLTCDDPNVPITRIGIYKGLVSYARALYSEEAEEMKCPEDHATTFNGLIYCFNHDGTLAKRIDIAKDCPTLPFLGNIPEQSPH